MHTLYDSRLSGNAWKLRFLMRELGIPYRRVSLDLAAGEARRPEFARISRFQRVPVLELENGACLVESGAIMMFLADSSDLFPADPVLRAEIASWLFFEQADLTRALGRARFFHLRGMAEEKQVELGLLQEAGYAGLQKLEAWLSTRTWLVAERFTLADIAVFPYVALAPVGGYDMQRFPAIRAWLARLEERPGWEPLVGGED